MKRPMAGIVEKKADLLLNFLLDGLRKLTNGKTAAGASAGPGPFLTLAQDTTHVENMFHFFFSATVLI